MKKRRRIEITTFRRRTTMIVRNPEGGSVEPHRHADTSASAPANLLPAEEVDLKQRQVAQPTPGGLPPIKLRE